MDRRETMELLSKEEEIRKNRIIAEKDGAVYVTFEDAAVLNSANAYDPQGTGIIMRNPDGSVASTGKRVHAVNPAYFFANRYKVKSKKLYVVSGHTIEGYRCIKEQSTGHTFIKTIPCYVIVRGEDGKLALDKVVSITDTEFISDFNSELNQQSMAEILPIITKYNGERTADAMPI